MVITEVPLHMGCCRIIVKSKTHPRHFGCILVSMQDEFEVFAETPIKSPFSP